MTLSTGGFAGLEWGYGGNGGFVYGGQSARGAGQNTDLGMYLNWVVYQSELMRLIGGVPSASTLNKQTPLPEVLRNAAVGNGAIPIVYGRARIGGSIFTLDYTSGTWTVGYIVCLGEIEGYESILINGEVPVSGVVVTYYTGTTSQTADPSLAAVISGYADDMIINDPAGDIGIAYIVVEYTDEHYPSWPSVVVEIEGRKVYNPATATTVYSANPALHLGDLISNSLYGLGMTVDATSLEAAMDYCDDATLGETRRESYTVLDSPLDTIDWVDILRGYASCFVAIRGDTAYLVPDQAGASVMTITAADIERDSLRITKKDSSDIPTVIRAYYTDTTGGEWRERLCDPARAAGVAAGTTQWRESRIRLPGIKRHSQAYRECVERLNKLALADLEVTWVQFDEALDLEAGDIVTVTHPYGLASKLLRLTEEPRQISPGRWAIRAAEYDPAAYSDEVASAPTYADGNLPTGGTPGLPTGLTVGETSYQTQNGEYATRLTIDWAAPTASFVTGYHVEVCEGSDLVWSLDTTGLTATTSPLKEGVLYTIKVNGFNSLYSGSVEMTDYTIVGKTAIPGPPTGLTGFEAGGEVRLWWVAPAAASDFDVRRYEVRYYTTVETWDDGTVIDQVDSLRIVTKDVPAGTWRLGVKSIDSIRQESATAAEVDLTVTLDLDAFRAGNLDPITTHASLTLVYADLNKDLGRTEYYSDGSDTWSSLFGSAMTTYTNSLASYQSAAGTSYWYSEELDMLQNQSGTFRALLDYTDHSGTAVVELGLKPNAGSYTWDTNLSQQGLARYLQVRVRSTGIFQVNTPQGYIYADIVAREETGSGTSSATLATTITLDNAYAAVRSIVVTPEGTAARIAVYDNVVYGDPSSFDVYIFDAAGAQVANDFLYQFKGV